MSFSKVSPQNLVQKSTKFHSVCGEWFLAYVVLSYCSNARTASCVSGIVCLSV